MQYLRKAVEKKRNYLIQLLVKAGVSKETEQLQNLTLTELELLSKKHMVVK
ncbi:Fur-regulated basic protein FbpA [Bacillus mesophilum]|uniref:Fur-regulated basic protein FbpA n=1 Tax=Bacillus mesophilum TaxID=1071718 RepID=A0A7V7RMH2_9BACI|nr:Fur-regulated basic protein FbpA [Bacillus mesophilum]KAB2333463.1 Fur-regulated basic protein FbpA [Bacillus mesophilum]